jgi:hypothetical protein
MKQEDKIKFPQGNSYKALFSPRKSVPGWQSGQFLWADIQRSSNAAGSRPVIPLGMLGFKLASQSRLAMKIPIPALEFLGKL